MGTDATQERQQAHALLDMLPPRRCFEPGLVFLA
jgi:hypothetical protein